MSEQQESRVQHPVSTSMRSKDEEATTLAPERERWQPPDPPPVERGVEWFASVPFFTIHIAALVGVILLGFSWSGLGLALLFYFIRMFGVSGGYHRYFSHRSYRTSRVFQFLLGCLGASSAQKGPLWWAAHHRAHHKYSDTEQDIHSVRQRGFYWAHLGWILDRRYKNTDWARVRDLATFPELRWLNTWHLVPPAILAVALCLVGGRWAFVWGFLVSTTLLWHGTFCVNSLSHLFGSRRYNTTDDSTNNMAIALFTLGEGWHNNHHHYQRSERQGFLWWQIDGSHYVLKALSWVGLVWDLHAPPPHVRDSNEPLPAGE
jgi:stearoyl-CoA desaturase (delta-9 desaturase)